MSQKYVIAHFFEPQTPSVIFPAQEWPLHVTLLPNFTIKWPLDVLIQKIDELTVATVPFDIKPEGQAAFGPKEDVPVTLIYPGNAIMELHNALMALSDDASFVYDTPQFIGKGFRPHATVQYKNSLQIGQTYHLDNLSLVNMFPNNDINGRVVIDTFLLRGK